MSAFACFKHSLVMWKELQMMQVILSATSCLIYWEKLVWDQKCLLTGYRSLFGAESFPPSTSATVKTPRGKAVKPPVSLLELLHWPRVTNLQLYCTALCCEYVYVWVTLRLSETIWLNYSTKNRKKQGVVFAPSACLSEFFIKPESHGIVMVLLLEHARETKTAAGNKSVVLYVEA